MDSPLDFTTLAQSAAQIVVKGLAGGAAQALRTQLVRLFTRGEPEQAEQSPEVRRLEETAQRLEKSPDRSVEERELLTSWKRRLEVFLEDHPDAAEELARIVDEHRPAQPEASYPRGSLIGTAGDGGIVIQAGRDNSGGVTK
ncbi:hypothetical protein [Amycolatopsis sp. NPDC051128]|uniref:hypothetical protein n=1 Tax=Amycolatopsis sp. NPDC051128 TaxID=3155412 RepID=UPI00341BA9DB